MGLALPLMPLIGMALASISGFTFFWYLTPVYVFVLIPVLDWMVGEDRSNPPESAVATLAADRWYRFWLMAYIPLHWLVLLFGLWQLTTVDLGVAATAGLVISMGLVSGGGINVAHEIGHKRGSFNTWAAWLALAPACYGHFHVEHNRGHHVRVSTPDDPASSRLGESYLQFWLRCVPGSIRSAWQLEQTRLRRLGLAWWHNENLTSWSLSLLLVATLFWWLGGFAVAMFLVQAVIGFSLLELVNYIEHYGLKRQRTENGQYERPQAEHSWNSNHLVSNLMLYHLQRHSDHHAHGARPYQALRHIESAPQLPAGYAVMIVLAMFPPLWRSVMDRRVSEHYQGDLSRANHV
ncbi:MAG: hypothetical protein DHS20C11_32450 [Lysobacteraceae bacterium]|nr:MAG: hypothetical protein DHS20C11_32450 [Xanthomonadaceae bacterium]